MLEAMEPSTANRETAGTSPAPARPLDDLARKVAAGDVAATRAFVTAVGPMQLRAVRGVLGARHPDVEDVLQESAFALVRAMAEFRNECSVAHFACRVAVLTAMAARRRSRVREKWHYDLESEDAAPASESTSPTTMVLAARRREILRALCDALPEAQAEALALQCIMGYAVEEIAATCGAPIDTIRSRLRLGKQALRKKVASDPVLAEALEVES
jgi:RNA polymerase sigma-70 factor (ECF subfamily)